MQSTILVITLLFGLISPSWADIYQVWSPDASNRRFEVAHQVGHAIRQDGNTVTHTYLQIVARATASREVVRHIQALLTQLGYDPGPVDGLVGSRTRAAARAFQRQAGLPIDGEISDELLKHLNAAVSEQQSVDSQSELARIAREIARGAGSVQKFHTRGKRGPIFVFEEYHTSRVGQIQIATMLLRLHERYGLKRVGLEGAIQSPEPLNGKWFHSAGGPASQSTREDIAVRILAEGEINAAEFMALVFPDVEVYGIETQSQYDVTLDVKTNPRFRYLLAIAEKLLSQADIRRVNELWNQGKKQEAVDYMLSRDSWVARQSEALKDSSPTSVERIIERIREIQQKANALGVQVEAEVEQDMANLLRFFEVASERSATMVGNLLNLPGAARGTPVAMIIGAAHTERVLDVLEARDVSFVLIRPLALNPTYGNLSIEQFERKNKGEWARISSGTLGRLLNSPRKPPPTIEKPTLQSYASMKMASIWVAEAARSGRGEVPNDDLWRKLSSLPEIRIDRNSFTRLDEYDVIFRAWLINVDGQEIEVWARVGTLDTTGQIRTLEQKLLQTAADLTNEPVTNPDGGGRIPPRDPPSNSQRAKDEGPGDGKRRNIVIEVIDRKTMAVFAGSKDEAVKIGRLSS